MTEIIQRTANRTYPKAKFSFADFQLGKVEVQWLNQTFCPAFLDSMLFERFVLRNRHLRNSAKQLR
jgi:hypothetical protein